MFSGRPKAYSLEDGALHLQFRGRAFGATGRGATGRPGAYSLVELEIGRSPGDRPAG